MSYYGLRFLCTIKRPRVIAFAFIYLRDACACVHMHPCVCAYGGLIELCTSGMCETVGVSCRACAFNAQHRYQLHGKPCQLAFINCFFRAH